MRISGEGFTALINDFITGYMGAIVPWRPSRCSRLGPGIPTCSVTHCEPTASRSNVSACPCAVFTFSET